MLRIQGLDPDRWSGCLSWSRKRGFDDGNRIMRRDEMKTVVTPLRRLVGWLGDPIEGESWLGRILEW